MTKKQKVKEIINKLEQIYPVAQCSLVYNKEKPYELLIATRLSAQCTDARVNIVTKPLFEKYQTLSSLATAKLEDVMDIIKSCGFYKVKSNDIILIAQRLLEVYGGELPSSMDELLTLSGIGRKTANLIMGDIFGQPAIITDTHCIRITNRLGLTTGKEPFAVEKQLLEILPSDKSTEFCHRLVQFGREYCKASSPQCDTCPLKKEGLCKFVKGK